MNQFISISNKILFKKINIRITENYIHKTTIRKVKRYFLFLFFVYLLSFSIFLVGNSKIFYTNLKALHPVHNTKSST